MVKDIIKKTQNFIKINKIDLVFVCVNFSIATSIIET